MSQWPNYYPTTYPAYNQPMQPQINPYMQRMDNLQPFQQNLQPQVQQQFTTLGKMVESMDIVKSTDIPMDGNPYYFPKADGSEVYMKRWLPNGTTETIAYKPILEHKDTKTNILSSDEEKLKFEDFNNVLVGIQEDIRMLSEKVDKINKPTRSKKEVSEDD